MQSIKYNINSFFEYIECLNEYKNKHTEEIWFRGQIDNRWKLEPNLYRNKVLDIGKNGIDILKYKTPDFQEEYDNFVAKIKKEKLFDIANLNKFQIMFLGQHYGLLTPALDWTTDPLAAIYFATNGYVANEDFYPNIYIFKPGLCNSNSDKVWSNGSKITEAICIDGLNMDNLFEKWLRSLEKQEFFATTAVCSKINYSYRISRQSGNFTFHGPIQTLSYNWNDIEINGERLVDTITINPNAIDEIKLYLKVLNVNYETLYKIDNDNLDDECRKINGMTLDKFNKGLL